MDVIVERCTKIFQDDFAYGVRHNADTGGLDIFYEEDGVQTKHIAVTAEAVPALITALAEWAEHHS